MYVNLCFRSGPCLAEYNGADIFQIGLAVFEKITKMCENGAKKCQTAFDFRGFPISNPANPT